MVSYLLPAINLERTGENIERLRRSAGYTVRDLQDYFGFETPQAIYKWQQGKNLPSVDNLLALSVLFGVTVNEIVACDQINMKRHRAGRDAFPFLHIILSVNGFKHFLVALFHLPLRGRDSKAAICKAHCLAF